MPDAHSAHRVHPFLLAGSSLILYRSIMQDPCIQTVLDAVHTCLSPDTSSVEKMKRFTAAYGSLLSSAELSHEPVVGSIWQNHLLNQILDNENLFSLKAGFYPYPDLSPQLKLVADADMNHLQKMFSADPIALCLRTMVDEPGLEKIHSGDPAPGSVLPMATQDVSFQSRVRTDMKKALHAAPDWTAAAAELASFYRSAGTGIIGRYKAFRWNSRKEGCPLEGIARPDPVTLDDLIGYSQARKEVIRNTRNLLDGYSANNVLLYGDRGTGKSSTVTAILNAYAEKGLRLVEVPRSQLQEFPHIIAFLKQYPQHFILFVDDLSFEDSEWNYKDLKAVLEGGLEVRPQNVVVYATSNRRHLIREKFSDRGTPRHQASGDEVHEEDTTQEKLSLADRFGITVTFATPDQELYLEIVSGLARLKGLDIDPAVLRRRALQWELWQNVRSGRTARQFIDDLEAELSGPKKNGSPMP